MKLTTNNRRKFRVSNKAKSVAKQGRFRLSISRSSKNISAQIIDDSKNVTLLSASSVEKDIKSKKKISKIFFDRGLYKYHGRVKVFAETLRKNGMEF